MLTKTEAQAKMKKLSATFKGLESLKNELFEIYGECPGVTKLQEAMDVIESELGALESHIDDIGFY